MNIMFAKKILRAMIEGRFCKKTIAFIDRRIGMLSRYFMSKKVKVQSNKIMFMTYQNDYTCNPKYIAEEIIRQNLPYELVWAVKKVEVMKEKFPSNIRLVKRNSYEFYKEAMTSKIWIDNALNFFWENVPKSSKTIKIDTWHGSMGLKRIGKEDVKNSRWVKVSQRCSTDTDFIISNSDFESQIYKTTHWPDRIIWKFGHPRNDILFEKDLNKISFIRDKVCSALNIPMDVKLALYAPTFRDSHDISVYDIDYNMLVKVLEKKFGGTWVVLARHHFKLNSSRAAKNSVNNLMNVVRASEYDDMQELMVVADIGITDYSSWICDFLLTKKPGFIFATDLELYNNERGLYYPLESTPFPVAKNNAELMCNIEDFDNELYLGKVNDFIQRMGCIEDGHACERVVKEIKEILNKAE